MRTNPGVRCTAPLVALLALGVLCPSSNTRADPPSLKVMCTGIDHPANWSVWYLPCDVLIDTVTSLGGQCYAELKADTGTIWTLSWHFALFYTKCGGGTTAYVDEDSGSRVSFSMPSTGYIRWAYNNPSNPNLSGYAHFQVDVQAGHYLAEGTAMANALGPGGVMLSDNHNPASSDFIVGTP